MLLASGMDAQYLGISAGIELNNTYLLGDELKGGENYRTYPSFGASFRLDFGKRSYLNSGIFYGSAGNEIKYYDDFWNVYEVYDYAIKSLKIPVQYGINVLKSPFQIGIVIGPIVGVGLSGRLKTSIQNQNQDQSVPVGDYNIYKDDDHKQKRLFVGLGTGLQFRYRNIGLEILYSGEVFFPDEVTDHPSGYMGIEALTIRLGYEFKLWGTGN
ncbi:outer membrane beta-barrel protein [Bacteroidota bacterium]